LETGNVNVFLKGMMDALSAIWRSLAPNGVGVIVCGRAKKEISGKMSIMKISDICLSAIERIGALGYPLQIESIITDRILMKRGSYFAVTHAKKYRQNERKIRRYGEDEILILRKA
jgi:hypothetical protein